MSHTRRSPARAVAGLLSAAAMIAGGSALPAVAWAPIASADDATGPEAQCVTSNGKSNVTVPLPSTIDARNYFCTYWGDINGKPAVVFSPKVTEEGKPIRMVGAGFVNLAGTDGARVGIKFTANKISRKPQLPPDVTGELNDSQAMFVWAVVKAEKDGSFGIDMDFPTTANSNGTDKESMTPGTTHVLNINSGSISPSGVDQPGASPTPSVKIIAAGTLEDELAKFEYKPTGSRDGFSGGDPASLPEISGASIADGSSSITATIPGVTPGTWVHLSPVSTDGAATPTKLAGQWVKLGADGTATFDSGTIADGKYNVVVHTAAVDGKEGLLGRIAWTHGSGGAASTGGATSTMATTPPSGPWFVGPPLTPFWSTSATKPSKAGTSVKASSKAPTGATMVPPGGGAGGGGAVAGGRAVSTTGGGGVSGGVKASGLPTSVPTSGRSGVSSTLASSPSSGTGSTKRASTSSRTAKPGSAASKSSGSGAQDGDVDMLAGDDDIAKATGMDRDLLFMLIGAAVILLVAGYASALVVLQRFLQGRRPNPGVGTMYMPSQQAPAPQQQFPSQQAPAQQQYPAQAGPQQAQADHGSPSASANDVFYGSGGPETGRHDR